MNIFSTKFKKQAFVLAIGLSVSCGAVAVENPWDQKLPVKEMTIEYTLSGMEKGTQTTYVKDYGRNVATRKNAGVSVFGMGTKTETLSIQTPEWQYEINLSKGTGSRNGNMNRYLADEFDELSRSDKKKVAANVKEKGISMVQGIGGDVQLSKEKFLGFDCDVASAMGVTTYTIANSPIVLKTDANIMGMKSQLTATNIKKGSVSKKMFEVPNGIVMRSNPEMDKAMRDHAKKMVAWLVAPEGKPMPLPSGLMNAAAAQQQSSPASSPAAPTQGAEKKMEVPPELGEALKGLQGLFGK